MRGHNAHQLSFMDSAFGDLRRLKEFADRLKAPPKPKINEEDLPKEKRPPSETAQNSFTYSQSKYKNSKATTQAADSEIIRYLSKASFTSFTSRGIIQIAEGFGTSEGHIRSLISSMVTSKYGR